MADFGQYIAGPLAAMILADAGAEVIRVDPPGGPNWQHPSDAILQRGKKRVALDLRTEKGRGVASRLIASCDILIENFRPGVMDRLGLGPAAMMDQDPALIYCSVPGFAQDDPRACLPGWEGVVSAAAGLYGQPQMMPGTPAVLFNAAPLASAYGAVIACHAIVASLIGRERFGGGERIEVPLFWAAMQAIGLFGLSGPPLGPAVVLNPAFMVKRPCRDGRYVEMSPPLRGFQRFVDYFLIPLDAGASELTWRADPEAVQRMGALLDQVFGAHDAADLEREAQDKAGAALAVCLSDQEWLQDEHARQTACVISQDDILLGETDQAGYAVGLTRTPLRAAQGRRPLDSDRESVLTELARRTSSGQSPATGARRLPLEDIRVIDTTQLLAGPTATKVLAEYGADVIKINDPRPEANPMGATGHLDVNRGKRSILLNLASSPGREILFDLLRSADVFHQNLAHDGAARLGFGEEAVRVCNPEIIYSSVSAHAFGGFRGGYRGHEELGQAVSGMQTRLGGTGPPCRAGWAVNDYGTGHLSALGILLALYHRRRTGEAQHVQAALSRTATVLQVPFMITFRGHAADERSGESMGWSALDRLYEAADGHFYLADQTPDGGARLAGVEGLDGLRNMEGERLVSVLMQRFRTLPADEWVTRLVRQGFAAQTLRTVEEIMQDPMSSAQGVSVVQDHEGTGPIRAVGAWARFSGPTVRSLDAAPPLGWHSRYILSELGRAAQYEELVAAGVINGSSSTT